VSLLVVRTDHDRHIHFAERSNAAGRPLRNAESHLALRVSGSVAPVRVLFVSSTTGGGSGRSQRELARKLSQIGHDIRFLVDDKRSDRVRRWCYGQLADASARYGGRPWARCLEFLAHQPGHRPKQRVIDGLTHLVTPVPENAFAAVAHQWSPDVVVGNSTVRLTWRKVRELCLSRGIATVLYVREVTSLGHFDVLDDPADVVVANAGSLQAAVQSRGHDCELIPSVVDLHVTRTVTDRSQILLVNPIASHGLDLFWQIAARCPHVAFRLQESWPLDAEQLAEIARRLTAAPNVEFLRRVEPGPELYSTARLLLVPHLLDNRPRVVLEAQSNGIPVIASDFPGLREAVGAGGVILAPDDATAWVHEIERLLADETRYDKLCAQAIVHGSRPEVDPAAIVGKFELAMQLAIDRAALSPTACQR
jgi:glycosyltransferase involved in cell wall biosynthesis